MKLTVETDTLHTIVDRTEVLDARTCRVDDHVATTSGTEPLESALGRAIYSRLYLGLIEQVSDPEDRRPPSAREDVAYVSSLRAAEGGRVVWQRGWLVTDVRDSRTEVRSEADGLRLLATASEIRPQQHVPGDHVRVAFPTERRFASPGFYLTHGITGSEPSARPCLRWYLNASPDVAPELFGALVRRLDAAEVPFTLKTLNDPAGPPRPDAMVLYTSRDENLGALVRDALARIQLRDRAPAFTRRLAAGIGIADDLEGPERLRLSFGLHRSLLVARGVIAAGPGAGSAARFSRVVAEFREAGIDPTRPHLGPGATDLELAEWSA